MSESRPTNLLAGICKFIIAALALVGVTTLFNIESVHHWLANPRLDVEVLSYYGKGSSSSEGSEPAFDEMKFRLNIVPRVRFEFPSYPVNQVKSIAVRTDKISFACLTDTQLPLSIRDEPVAVEVTVFSFPIKTPDPWKDAVIEIIDRWGQLYSVPFPGRF